MSDFNKCIFIDKAIILCGSIGVIVDVVAIIMAIMGRISFDISFVVLIPVAVFFIIYGFKQIKHDKERFNQK